MTVADTERAEIVRLYLAGESITKIARDIGRSQNTVRAVIDARGLMRRRSVRWTDAETAAVRDGIARGLRPREIAKLPDLAGKRSVEAVMRWLSFGMEHRKKPVPGARRRCLACPTMIVSEGAHHRLCGKCRDRINASSYALG